ncbi:MAG: pantetheine-phosphate adenylyltransferase [Firmicutes bacterium]|nr:pantetheine-phosphate adenylyltransferase [Bacillota bacterium]
MNIAVYPGSFDPTTNGHLDVIERAAKIVDKLIVGVLINPNKKGLFTVEERVEQLKSLTQSLPNVEVRSFSGLLVDFARSVDARIVIRGLRAVTDFEYEFQMALTNRSLAGEIETLFIPTSAHYMYVSSSMVKEVASFGKSVEGMVPESIQKQMDEKYKNIAK